MSVQFRVDNFETFDGTVMRYGLMKAENSDNQRCPIIFVPGLGGSVKFALSFLEKLVPDHGPVYSMDGRGFGLNESLAPQPNPGDYLKDFDRFIQHLQETGRLNSQTMTPIICGLSLGSVFTTLYLTRHQHPFQAAILVSPAFCPHPKTFNWAYKLRNYRNILFKGLGAMVTLPYGIQELTRNEARYDDPHFKERGVMPSMYLLLVQMLCKKAMSRTRQISIPTAIIIPEQDVVCDPDAMRTAFARLPHPQKTLLSYPELYHDVVQEIDEDICVVCKDLGQWIATITENTPSPFQPDKVLNR